jgi:hypothetical protein
MMRADGISPRPVCKRYTVLRKVDSMTGATIRYSWRGMRSRNVAGAGLIGRKHVERNEIDGNAARSFKP